MACKEFLHEHIISDDLRTFYGHILNLKSVYLDSDIRSTLKFSINSVNISYLFRKELILSWPNITVLGSLKRWLLMLARSLVDFSNKFGKPKQDVSFKQGELVMLLRLPLFLFQFETLKLFISSLIFFTNIDLQ